MHVLLIGASGFIGEALARALIDDGHRLTGFGRGDAVSKRQVPRMVWAQGDLRAMTAPASWMPLLTGIDVVINASGALQTGLRDNLERVQHAAIAALGQAAEECGVKQIIQISAAGAGQQPDNPFMQTKAAADATLLALSLPATVLRPGLVIGRNAFGGSELLRAAAALPGIAVELEQTGRIQCVALADVVSAVRAAVARPTVARGAFDLVEADSRSLAEVIAQHRAWLGFGPARCRVSVPRWALALLSAGADAFGWLGWRSPFRSNAMAALTAGISGDVSETETLLGRAPLSLDRALASLGGAGKADRWHARLALVYPLALVTLVFLWLTSGVIGLLQSAAAEELLRPALGDDAARAAVLAGSVADVLVALGIVWRPTLSLALKAGIAVASAYLVGALLLVPAVWLDPLGPMVKVVPVVALMTLGLAMAEER